MQGWGFSAATSTNMNGDWGKFSGGPSAAPMSHNLTDQSPAMLGKRMLEGGL